MDWRERFIYEKDFDKIQKSKGCFIEVPKKREVLEKFNTSLEHFYKLVEWLDWYWKTEHKFFKENPSWPVLVIFKEVHNDNTVKRENFEAFIPFRDYFNFLATEWTDKEVIWNNDIVGLQWDVAKTVDFILWGFSSFSSVALEGFYVDNLNTCWVDLSWLELKKLSALNAIPNIAKEKWLSFEDALDYWYKNWYKYVIENRNKLWLQNMKNILLSWNNINWKNFIPIIAWWAHAEDLSSQAKNFWFKWVIIFTPKSYQ